MVLSKRWQYLWTLVPRLVYDDGNNSNITKESFSRFVDRSLLLHEAPVLEYVRFKLGEKSSDVDNIGVWARTVSRRHVRGDEHVKRFLSNCPLLENLYVDRCLEDNVTVFTVRVPSLKTLYMCDAPYKDGYGGERFVIDAPSLETLTIDDSADFTLCRCERQWLNLLMCVLRDSPKLRTLKLVQVYF
nr:unnamed protein product [Brassica rapa]